MRHGRIITTMLFAMLAAGPAAAQVDLAGQWGNVHHVESMQRGAGPDLGDYTGLPINDEARHAALTYTASSVSMTERGCMFYTENYILIAVHNIMIERVNDPVTGDILAWRVSAGGSDRAPITIWMDGRPHPSANAPRSFSGFATGRWEGDRLVARMTHMKRGVLRRNGVPLSDRASMTLHFVRHAEILTITGIIEDPIYLDEKLVLSMAYRANPRGNAPATNPTCFPFTELPGLDEPGTVPHFLPGTNPDEQTFAKHYNLPLDAAYGGVETLYPEFRRKLQGRYTPPMACTRYCCVAGGLDPAGLTCRQR
jgi:hypothetical protein